MTIRRLLPFLIAASAAALLAACGGGGGGGGGGSESPVQYSGNSSAAVVTSGNASGLVANVFGSGDSTAIVTGLSVTEVGRPAADAAGGLIGLGRRLNQLSRNALAASRPAPGLVRGLIPVEETELCDDSGSVRTFGTLNDDGTGTLNVHYNDCRIEGETLSGQATLRIDAFDLVATDFTFSFPRLRLRGTGLSVDIGGTLRTQLAIGSQTETITENLVSLDNLSGRMTKSENLVVVSVFDNLLAPSLITSSISGRIFDSVHGYVDVTTLLPIRFASVTQAFPGSGQVLLTGSANRSIRVTALSPALVKLELDLDVSAGYESTAVLGWSDLSGPIGADLADDDGDGMHDSWETAYGLNLAIDDGLLDADGDGFNNLKEYRGGGAPNDVASIPSMLVGPVFPVSSGVSNAISDTEIPGRSGIGSDGTNFLVASCRQLGPTTGVFGVTSSGSGQVLNNFPILNTNCPARPAVAFDGANYLVVFFNSNGEIVGTRVTTDGTVLDGSGLAVSSSGTSNFHPAVAYGGTHYLVVWQKFVDSIYWIYGATITPDGTVSSEFPISGGNGDSFPATAFDGTNFLVVWTQTGGDVWDVLGARLSPAGTVLDSPPIAIASLAGIQSATGVAFDGTNYLVVWDHHLTTGFTPPPDGKVFGRLIAPNGSLLDGAANTDGIAISTGAYANHSSSVAFADSHYIVTWAVGSFPNFPPAGIYATRVSRSGARIDGLPNELGVSVSGPPPASSRFVYPVVASGGQDGLVAWANNIELFGTQKDILGASISGF